MTVVKISRASDVPKIVRQIFDFEPKDSIVIIGIGGGPTARLDIGDLEAAAEALRPAAPQWQQGVIAVLYSNLHGSDAANAMLTTLCALIDVPLIGTGFVGNGWVTALGQTEPHWPDGRTREDMGRTITVSDPDLADREAESAYLAGNGALAWLYLDRALHLRGYRSDAGLALEHKLINAVDPRGQAS